MNESMHKYFNIGLMHFMAYPDTAKGDGPILETIKKILVDDYFDTIEITHINDDTTRTKVKNLIAQSYIKVCYCAQPIILMNGLNPNAVEETERLKAQKRLALAIDEAEFMGAKDVVFLAGKWDENTKDKNYAQLVKTTSYLCEYASSKAINIELEIFDYDLDKAALIGPAPLAARFAEDIRSKHNNFGLLCDLSHFPLTYETSDFVFNTLKKYITHLHIGNAVLKKNAANYGDNHPRFGFPSSVNDVTEVLDFLRVCRNVGMFNEQHPMTLSFEVKPYEDEDPDIVVANAKRVLNRAWALL